MRELRVDMFSTIDGYGGPGPRPAPYWGYGAPGLYEWVNGQLAEEHVMLMGAKTYRQMSEIVADGDDPSFPRMAQLPKIVFSKTLKPPLTWANTTIIDEPLATAVPALKATADGVPMRTIGSRSLVRSLFRLGLVDRLCVMVFPMIHGTAGEEPVFTELPAVDLGLIGTTVIDERLVLLDYRIGGDWRPRWRELARPNQARTRHADRWWCQLVQIRLRGDYEYYREHSTRHYGHQAGCSVVPGTSSAANTRSGSR